jgi:hypothetical protein
MVSRFSWPASSGWSSGFPLNLPNTTKTRLQHLRQKILEVLEIRENNYNVGNWGHLDVNYWDSPIMPFQSVHYLILLYGYPPPQSIKASPCQHLISFCPRVSENHIPPWKPLDVGYGPALFLTVKIVDSAFPTVQNIYLCRVPARWKVGLASISVL